jgi:transcriptional regulator with XRE-family HTH domain
MQRFGEKVRTLRIRSGLTLRELAQALGYSAYSYISDIETGRTVPRIEFMLKIADYFHVSLDQLARDELDIDEGRIADTDDTA